MIRLLEDISFYKIIFFHNYTILILNSLTSCSLDEMGQRVDDLEKNISELMQQVDAKEDTTVSNTSTGQK